MRSFDADKHLCFCARHPKSPFLVWRPLLFCHSKTFGQNKFDRIGIKDFSAGKLQRPCVFVCRASRCPISGWRATCRLVPNVQSVIKPAGACCACRTGGVSGAKLRWVEQAFNLQLCFSLLWKISPAAVRISECCFQPGISWNRESCF